MDNRVLVVGGGIAGPVTAVALQQAGLHPVLYEAYGRGSEGVGAFLTLAVNGIEALGAVGLREPVERLGMETPGMTMVSGRGKHLGTLPMRARTVSRSDLYQVLRDEAVRRGVVVEYGKRLVDATTHRTGVTAVFEDGTSAEGDLLVGADGLRSRTRSIIDPKAPAARHIGLLNTGGYARGLRLPGEPGVAHFVFGRRCFFGYFLHPDGDVWWFANPPSRREPSREELLAFTSEQWRARLVDLFADDQGPMLEVIAATDEIIPGWNTYDLPSVPRWHDDRMVVIGDAVHAASPSSGQGASLAIEDAVLLAMCLRDHFDALAAFRTFEALRRERVERVVRHGKRSGDGKADGPVKARIRDLVLPALMRRMTAKGSLDWMLDYRIDWDASVCEARPGEAVARTAAQP
ncbi:MAG TPA: NAD(P)/FAD-dependent oxidoreductase [Jiangellales bacterium]|nr:NAD(P)/FAD-dependent oxidoreductase [Jiangellales bacterium]